MSNSEIIISSNISEYLNLFKPRSSFLLTYTGVATYAYASGWTNIVNTIIFFIFGALATFGANTLNNYFDKDTDTLMDRTKERSLPKGIVKSSHAFFIGVSMTILSVVTFSIWFNLLSAYLIILGTIYYSLFYTLYLKKRTSMNIVIGGFAGVLPILTGWAAATGEIGSKAILFSLIVFLWSPGHFWALALKFKDDYKKAKLPMLTSITNTKTTINWIITFNFINALSIGLSIIIISTTIYQLLASTALLLLIVSSLLIYIKPNESSAWQAYKLSSPVLGLIFTGLLIPFI